MKKAVAYMRMSTDQQEHSIESQKRLINDYAARNSYLMVGNYMDEGISGRQAAKRPAFLKMIDDSVGDTFEAVLIYDSSRFARNLEESIVYKSILGRNGVALISITEPTLDDDTSIMADALLGAMNEMYSRKLSKNVKRGLEQKALRGEYIAAHPFGYSRPVSGETIQIEPAEAEIVRYIFQRFEAGQGLFSITRELGALGAITHYGNKIEVRGVDYILTNPVYKGYLRLNANGQEILKRADHDPILSEEEFDRVQGLMETYKAQHKRKSRPSSEVRHWLSGIVRCSFCGKPFGYAKGYGGRSDRFRCGGVSRGVCTESGSILVTELERLVMSALSTTFHNRQNWDKLNIKLLSPPTSRDFAAEAKRLQQSLSRAHEAYCAGVDTLEEYKVFKSHVTDELTAIGVDQRASEEKRIHFDEDAFAKKLISAMEALESNADLEQKKHLIRQLMDNIVLNTQTMHVECFFFG